MPSATWPRGARRRARGLGRKALELSVVPPSVSISRARASAQPPQSQTLPAKAVRARYLAMRLSKIDPLPPSECELRASGVTTVCRGAILLRWRPTPIALVFETSSTCCRLPHDRRAHIVLTHGQDRRYRRPHHPHVGGTRCWPGRADSAAGDVLSTRWRSHCQ